MKKGALLLCLLLFNFRSHAEPLSLSTFQVNGIGVYQTSGGKSYSLQGAWIPSLSAGGVGLRGELGATLLKSAIDTRFFVVNLEAFLQLPIIPSLFSIEGGGGLETWMGGNGGTHPILSIYAVFGLGIIERIYLGYSRFLLPGNNSNQWKLGLGFSL